MTWNEGRVMIHGWVSKEGVLDPLIQRLNVQAGKGREEINSGGWGGEDALGLNAGKDTWKLAKRRGGGTRTKEQQGHCQPVGFFRGWRREPGVRGVASAEMGLQAVIDLRGRRTG
eukprot:755596-Hanusia_phi.AAC.1